MTLFWITIAILLACALGVLLVGGSRNRHDANERDALNLSLYHQQLQELDYDAGVGVVGEKRPMLRTLQRTLLEDIPGGNQGNQAQFSRRRVLIPGVLVILLVSCGGYLFTGGLPGVMALDQARHQYPQLLEQVMSPQAAPPAPNQLAELALGLRSALHDNPTNIAHWRLLGRLSVVLGRPQNARQAFHKAALLAPGDTEVQLDYLEMLVMSKQAADNKEARLQLDALLKQHPDNVRALALSAQDALQLQDNARARSDWQALLRLLPPGDSRAADIRAQLDAAGASAQ